MRRSQFKKVNMKKSVGLVSRLITPSDKENFYLPLSNTKASPLIPNSPLSVPTETSLQHQYESSPNRNSLGIEDPPTYYECFIDYPTEGPSTVLVHPLANKVQNLMDSYLPPPHHLAGLMTTFQIPYSTEGPLRVLRESDLAMMPNIPMNVYDRYPQFLMFNMSLKIMI